MEDDEVSTYLIGTEDDAYAAVGRSLVPPGRDFSPSDVKRLVDIGRAWFTNNVAELRQTICDDPRIFAVHNMTDRDATKLFLVIMDVLAAKDGWPPPATVSALIVKIGIDRICGEA
jgi:hypothetical protein